MSKVTYGKYTVPDEQAVYEWLYTQLGKKYDVKAIIGFPLFRDWQDESEWFCSELLGCALLRGGRKLVQDVHRLMPDTLYQLRD